MAKSCLLVEIRIMFFQAFGTQAVAELGIRVFGYVFFEPFPALPVIPDLVTMHADGQDTPGQLHQNFRPLKIK